MPDGVCSVGSTSTSASSSSDEDGVCSDPDAKRRRLDAEARGRAEEHWARTPLYSGGDPVGASSSVTRSPLYMSLDDAQRGWMASPAGSSERATLQTQIDTLTTAAYALQGTASAAPVFTPAASMTATQIDEELARQEAQLATFQQFTPPAIVARVDELRQAQHTLSHAPADVARPPMLEAQQVAEIDKAKDAAFLARSEHAFLAAYGDTLAPADRAQRLEYVGALEAKWRDLRDRGAACREARPTLVQANEVPKSGTFTAQDWIAAIKREPGVVLTPVDEKHIVDAFAQWRLTQCWETSVDPSRFANVSTYSTAEIDQHALAQDDADKRMQMIDIIRGNPLASISIVASMVQNDSVDQALVRMGATDYLTTVAQIAPWGLPSMSREMRVGGPMPNGRTLDENAQAYGETVRSAKAWDWRHDIPGGGMLTNGQRGAIRQEAIRRGYLLGGVSGTPRATLTAAPKLSNANEARLDFLESDRIAKLNAEIAEVKGYNQALDAGHISIQPPGNVSEQGPDFITFDLKEGAIVVWDAKYRGPGGAYPTTVPAEQLARWMPEVRAAVDAMVEGPQKTLCRAKVAAGNVDGRVFKWPPQVGDR